MQDSKMQMYNFKNYTFENNIKTKYHLLVAENEKI